jgi:hypothetical protein
VVSKSSLSPHCHRGPYRCHLPTCTLKTDSPE